MRANTKKTKSKSNKNKTLKVIKKEIKKWRSEQIFDLQVIIASGLRDIGKVTAGLAFALSAASSGAKVVVFLTMEGAAFANPDEGKLKYIERFENVQRYFTLLLEEGVFLEVCTACAENYCLTGKIKNNKKIRSGMYFAGISTAAIRSLKVKSLVF